MDCEDAHLGRVALGPPSVIPSRFLMCLEKPTSWLML